MNKSKNPSPKGPTLILPKRGGVYLIDVKWNNGMSKIRLWMSGIMEYWVLKTEFILILISVLTTVSKKRFYPFEPIIFIQ